MNYKSLLIIVTASILLFSACSKEEGQLEPSGIKDGYTVPQGNHDYDTTIVSFYKNTGSYLLYDFTEKDAYWTPSAWKNGVPTSDTETGTPGFLITMPDLNYIAPQLDLLNKTWFHHYPQMFLKEFLPLKILLCSDVQYCSYDFSLWPPQVAPKSCYSYYNYDNISVAYASSAIETMTSADTLAFARAVNRSFIESMVGRGKCNPTSEFTASTTYANVSMLYTNSQSWAIGVFQPYYAASSANDWHNFVLMMVSYSETYLNNPDVYLNDYDYSETAWEGIFSSTKDTNGMMKLRYNIVRNYYIDKYGVDLQQIGNAFGK